MTRPEWEPLTTAEAVLEAYSNGRHVERRRVRGLSHEIYGWAPERFGRGVRAGIAALLDSGCEYRARIEGGAE